MPTVLSHAVLGLTLAAVRKAPGSFGHPALVGALCAVVPDLDGVGLRLGVPWEHALGHRGLTHSLPFAASLAAVRAIVAAGLRGRRRGRG